MAGVVQVHLVVGGGFVQLRVDVRPFGGKTGVILGGLPGGLRPDGHTGGAGFDEVLQLLHRKEGQLLEGEAAV